MVQVHLCENIPVAEMKSQLKSEFGREIQVGGGEAAANTTGTASDPQQ